MFRRPEALPPLRGPMPVVRETYPVVQRQAGTPPSGEVQEYIDKGYDTYEFTGDQAQDKGGILQWLKKQGNKISDFMDKPTDQWGEGTDYVLDEYEFNLLYPNVDINSTTIEERTIDTNGDDYRRLVEITTRAEGSPPTGETSYYSQTINPEIVKEQDIALDKQTRSHEQWLRENDAGVNRIITTNIMNVAEGNANKPTVILDAVANSFSRFGRDETLKMLIGSNFHQTNPKIFQYIFSLDENFPHNFQYEEEIEGRKGLYEYLGSSDDYYHTEMPKNMKRYIDPLMEIMSTDIVSRQLGSPMQGEITPQESNMYYGDPGEQELHRELIKVANGQITNPQEIQSIITASIGEFGEGHVMAIIKEGGALMSSAEGQFSGMPHQGTGMDGPYWNQAVSRQMGSPPMGEQVNANNVGIMDGFNQEEDRIAESVMTEGEGAREAIDQSSTYDELMRAIRGDNLSEADRRQELASYVGEKDAEETPDSVLTLVQPVMQMLDQDTANTGIAQTEEAMMMANAMPTQGGANAEMAMMMPQQPVGVAHGGIVQHFNQGELAQKHADYLPTYMSIVDKYSDPEQGKADALFALSQAGFNYGLGATPTEAGAMFFDRVSKEGSEREKTDRALRMKMDLSALSAAQAEMLSEAKASKEQSKQKQNYTVGLNDETDNFIGTMLGITKVVDTQSGPHTSKKKVVDYERLYQMFPKGTPLQWSWDFSQFLGKKGSAVRYEGVEKKDGGIVHRQDGTPPNGEIVPLPDQIIDQEGLGTSTEKDDINKIIARSQATLKELLRMKEILTTNPEIGGFPGALLETFQGLFTMLDQIDNAYLSDQLFRKEGKLTKMFNKAEIQEIQSLKNSIASGLADLRSFKGTRQPTKIQEEMSLKEIDPTGWFGSDVAMQKVDATADKVARLLKEYVKIITTTGDDTTIDAQVVTEKFADIDSFVEQIKNFSIVEETYTSPSEDSMSLDDLEAIINPPIEGN